MLNILIIEDDPNQVKNLITILSRNFSTIRVFSISFDGKSALEIIQNNEIDIILLDLKLSKMCGIDIVNFIECKNLYRYKNSIIIFTGEVSLLRQILHSQYLFSYCLKGNGYNALLKSFRNLIKEKMENKCHTLLSVKIDHELNFLNFNFSHCGTKYLKETIMEVYKIRDDFSGNLEKNIFPILAKKYSKSVNTIYCNIKNEVKNMTINCDETLLSQYFGYYFFIQPKVNDVIFTILNKIIKT